MSKAEPVRLGLPSSFERDELVAVALELGPDNLALRNVAEALGVPRTTVYNHVRSPDELGQLVLSSIFASLAAPPGAPSSGERWESQLEAFALRHRETLLAAGPWVRYYDPNVHITRESPSRRPHYRGADHRGLLGGGRRPRRYSGPLPRRGVGTRRGRAHARRTR